MNHDEKAAFQLLTLITTPKLADQAAELFKKERCRCNTDLAPRALPPARSWICSDSAASTKAF